MKAAQIEKYSKQMKASINDISIPEIKKNEVLLKVKVAAVNPLELLTVTGSVKLIQDYKMPLTLGNELTGVVEVIGENVTTFKPGDKVYTRLPVKKIGAFAEFVAVEESAIWFLPNNLDFVTGAGVALTGLTAYQAIVDILKAKRGETLFIPGGSGGFGQMAVPIAKHFGLHVIVSGNSSAKERILEAGADQYIDYKKEKYWELLKDIDYVIDTLGQEEFDRELSIIKKGGTLLSLVTGPNKQFAKDKQLPKWKQVLFGLAGAKYDKKAEKHDITYRFMFVEANGKQLKEITDIVEKQNIVPKIEDNEFYLNQINEAFDLVHNGHPKGKVIVKYVH